jgi:predicted dehydrogenase
MHVAMLGSYMPGDWALGEHFGAMQEETHAFINTVGTGRPNPILATGNEGMDVLVISRAVDESAQTGQVVPMTWAR